MKAQVVEVHGKQDVHIAQEVEGYTDRQGWNRGLRGSLWDMLPGP